MSTHDSYFLCWSSVLANDVVVPLLRGDWFRNPARHRSIELNQRQRVLLTRVLIVLIGVAIYAVSLLYQLGQNLWDYMAVTGAIYYSGAFALLSAGLYWKRASSTGAILAIFSGCLAVFGLTQLRAWMLIDVLGFSEGIMEHFTTERIGLGVIALTMVAMVAGSLLFPDKRNDTPAVSVQEG